MSRRTTDIDTDIEVELPGREDITVLSVTATVHNEYWSNTGWECWLENLKVTREDGSLMDDIQDMHGMNVWAEAEQVAMDAAR